MQTRLPKPKANALTDPSFEAALLSEMLGEENL